MELNELNADERVALAGLVKMVLLADGQVSDDEVDEVADIADALGQEGYESALEAFETRCPDEQTFKRFLGTIKRQEARELIYATVIEGASADAIEGGESELLTWLEEAWNVEVTVQEPIGGEGSAG